jgi:hypothetical protein
MGAGSAVRTDHSGVARQLAPGSTPGASPMPLTDRGSRVRKVSTVDVNSFINGTQVLAIFPIRSGGRPHSVIVVLARDSREVDPYGWTEMDSLDAEYSLLQGHYFRDEADAMAAGLAAAGWLGAVRCSMVGREHV